MKWFVVVAKARSRRNRRRLLLPALALLAAIAVAAAVFAGSGEPALVDTDAADEGTAAAGEAVEDDGPSATRMAPLLLPSDSGMSIGDPDAPLVMVAFESFGCLWCGHMHTRTMPMVLDDYVEQGRLRIDTRMLPYEAAASPGARIGAAAGLQGRYWELAEHLYPFIAGAGAPPLGRDLTELELGAYRERQSEDALLAEVLRVADDIDLDWERFFRDYDSDEVRRIVARDTALARELGFTGTPAVIVNGVPVGGYRSPEAFEEFLDGVLDASTG